MIPFSSRMNEVPEDPILVRDIPKQIEFPEEEVFQEKPPPMKENPEIQEVQEITPPPTPQPPALSVEVDVQMAPSNVQLYVNSNFEQDMDFDVETIVAVAQKVLQK